ncbi:HlyD family efflux transporter periplasmic adaptor subunit [Novosphingobium sp. PY1]|uniref:HlyD family efflux transporter periplasmic adaptor subunit n=1 Tax=Novosphingobium sp. PY1 TaxID=1882221 RepID=UPI001A8D9246|nr:HlyD family efflux transporter periplasmic adaptor subunit [Novosphingobium sp. PY1]GFM29465.1 secretion protein HlyD family protein [Novosphingobium sp. PY1]
MKKIAAAIVGLIVVMAFGYWLSQGHHGADGDELVLHGNVDIRQVSLAFEGNGRVEQLNVDEGDAVEAGTVLARLDTTTLSLQAEQARAQVSASQQNLLRMRNGSRPEEIRQAGERLAAAMSDAKRAADDLARMEAISDRTDGRGVSRQEIDSARNAAKVTAARAREQKEALRLAEQGPRAEDVAAAQAQLKGTQAQLALLEHQISQGELRAPENAVVRTRLLEVGDMASPQRPIYELALTSPKWIRVYVDETDLGRIKPGQAARVTSDSFPDQPVSGKVGYISSVAEFTPKSVESEELRTSLVYEVRVRVEDAQNRLRLGQPVTVRIAAGPAR